MTVVYDTARALAQLQTLIGNIRNVHGQGRYSNIIFSSMSTILNSNDISNAHSESVISDLILIDRDVDYASVLLSQLNYEGLLDEAFEIKCGKENR